MIQVNPQFEERSLSAVFLCRELCRMVSRSEVAESIAPKCFFEVILS
jgi:hypothetical protein